MALSIIRPNEVFELVIICARFAIPCHFDELTLSYIFLLPHLIYSIH